MMQFVLLLLMALLAPIAAKASCTAPANASTQTAVNIKDSCLPGGGATGNGSTDDTAAIQAAIDYAFAHNVTGVYCPQGAYKTSGPLYLDPPGNLRSNLSAPTIFSFSMSFFGDPAAGGNYQGCKIEPNFNNNVAFYIGPGQGMRVSDIAVISSASGYRGNISTSGVGIGLTGGNGGSSINLVENTYVSNFYSLYETDANGACCLNDSNTFRKVSGDNGFYGINFEGTQSYINDVIEPRISATVDIYSPVGKAVNIYGGNLSAGSGQAGTFSISSVSAFSKVTDGNGFDYSFTATIASPDQYVPNVYNSYTIATTHFGVIPLTMTAWNASTDVGTFQLRTGWVFSNYGTMDLTTTTDMQAEVAAATSLYAAERVTVAWGQGISLDGAHIENPSACATLLNTSVGFSGSFSNTIKEPYFNYDPSQHGNSLPISYCQQAFPFIWQQSGGDIVLDGGTYGQGSTSVLVESDVQAGSGLTASSLVAFRPNFGIADSGGYTYGQKGGNGQWEAEARGIGKWDELYALAAVSGLGPTPHELIASQFVGTVCGVEPCPWITPNISDQGGGFASVCPSASLSGSSYTCSALGSLGSYAPVPCRAFYALVDWNTSSLPNSRVRSASCPGWSWGQNLTNATTGGTVTWLYKGQSDALYIDSKSMTFMFPGLNIVLPDPTSGNDNYIVTGVFADLGYVTVIAASTGSGAPLAGVKTTVYSCSSSCTIGQNAFVWSAYP